MARLTVTQAKLKVEREKEKQETIKKKMEAQQLKEAFGEDWKKIVQKTVENVVESEIGGEGLPRVYDSKDLYDFFDPIRFYKDADNSVLNMDFSKFIESEDKYRYAIEKLDEELARISKEEKEQKKTGSGNTDDKSDEEKTESLLENDGVSDSDNETPYDKTSLLNKGSKVSNSPASIAKGRLNQISSTYLNRFVPLYNKHICTCCGKPKDIKEYYVVYDLSCSDRVDKSGNYHMWICKECVQKLLMYYYSVPADKNIELATQYLCSSLNLYWDVDLFYAAKQKFEESGRKGTLIGSYISTINTNSPGLSFMDSPFLTDEQYNSKQRSGENIDEAPFDWSKEDARNKRDIVHIFGYDPFEFEENEDEKKILYADLASIVDEDVQQDYVKLQSALTIVKSFNKVRKLDETAHKMEVENAPLNEQKSIADLKAKELKAISDFSRDSGFSERFKTRQNQGQTSFTGIMKMMNEKKFENELINRYDIQTSSTIQAAADASFKAIFNQLNLSEAEAYKIAADQLEELRKVRKELEKTQEELRITKYELAEIRLKEKAREKGVDAE